MTFNLSIQVSSAQIQPELSGDFPTLTFLAGSPAAWHDQVVPDTHVIEFEPAEVADWEAEDQLTGRLAALLDVADPDQAQAMLSEVRLEIPDVIDHTELTRFSAERGTPLAESLVSDVKDFDFNLVELPLTILVPEGTIQLVRLRLRLAIDAGAGASAVAYDLFPRDDWSVVQHDVGNLSLDVAKALTFVCPPLGEALGLKLNLPLRWKSTDVRIRTSDRLSNPVEWYVTDRSINQGFTAYLIARSPKGANVKLHATVLCQLRKPGLLGRLMKSSYRSAEESYDLS